MTSELIKCGSRVVRMLFNKTMQNISAKLGDRGDSHVCLTYLSTPSW